MVDSVKKQLNYVVGCLLNSLQNKAAMLEPVRLFMDQMIREKFNGAITFDYLSKGIDYANFCVATKDLTNIRQGWPKLSDEFSVGMSAAFVLNNESVLQQIPEQLRPMIQNSAMAFSTELNAAINFSNNGSINMYPNQNMMQMMPQQGVQQFPANGVQQFMQQPMQMMPQGFGGFQQQMPFGMQQQPQLNQQQVLMFIQQNPQLMQMYQQNPQMAMQQAAMVLQQSMMQNPYMQRANTVSPMPQNNMMPQAPVTGFINNNQAFGTVPSNQVGTARGSSFAAASNNGNGGANIAPQPVQLAPQQNNQHFQPQPTAQQPSAHQQVIGANVVHAGKQQPVNMTQQIQPIQNANTVPNFAIETNGGFSNIAAEVPTEVEPVIANEDMTYDINGRRISKIYSRENQIVVVDQDHSGVVLRDTVVEAKVKYEEHESQRILPVRTKAEKRAAPSNERMNQVLELASNEVSYKQVLEKIRADQEAAGEELVDLDVSRIIAEMGTQSVRLDVPTYALNKTAILPIIRATLDQNQMPIDTATRSVITDVVIGAPLNIGEALAAEIDKLNKSANIYDYIHQLESISHLDIPNLTWSWIHDEVLKEINNLLEKYFGLAITIDSVLMDLDKLIEYIADNYSNDLSTQVYNTLHVMLTNTVLQVFRHDEWKDIVDEGQILIGKIYRVITLPMVTCQVPYNAPGKSGIVDRNSHTQLTTVLDKVMKQRGDYHSLLMVTIDNDIIEVSTTTIDGNYVMYCGNE